MESQHQNPKVRNNPENFHPCILIGCSNCSKISNTLLFLFPHNYIGDPGWDSQNACQNCNQGIP